MQHSRIWICAALAAAFLLVSGCIVSAANVTISGTVRDVFGAGVGSVTVRANTGQSVNTAANGSYSLSLPEGWSGLVAPEGSHLFQPINYNYTNISANISGQDYIATPQFFVYLSTSIYDSNLGDLACADFNNDGFMDVAVVGHELDLRTGTLKPKSRIWNSSGTGDYSDATVGLTGVQDSAAACCDYDNDGNIDLLIAGDTESALVTKLYRNEGSAWASVTSAVFPGVKHSAIAWADFDNDGRPDVLIAGESASGRITKLFHNNGDDTFSEVTGLNLPGVSHCSVAWADYDNDGRMDFAIAGESDSGYITKIFHNDADGGFSDIQAPLTGVSPASICWGDYNNDGYLDLAVSGERSDSVKTTRICQNTGAGFTELDMGLPGAVGSIVWLDYNNNGKLDLAISGTGLDFPVICNNNGDDTFTIYPITVSEGGVTVWKLKCVDYDKNGKVDLIASGESQTGNPTIVVYKNTTTAPNTAPSAPSALAATFEDNTLTMSWSAASDAQTPAAGLNYNIRVGTAPGLSDTFSGMAASNGQRRVLALGNAGHKLSWQIHNLPARAYYWSVQAIDGAYTGSAWATEAMIKPDTTAPTLSISEPSVAATNSGPVSFTVTYQGASSITLAAQDISLNTTGTATGSVAVSGTGNTTRTVTISSITGDGTIGISIGAGTASNLAGDYAAGAGPSSTFAVGNTAPTVNIGSPSSAITRSGPVSFTISYANANAITLAGSNITLNKTGTADGTISVSGAGLVERTVTISNITGNGALGISIGAGTATDTFGNGAPAIGPSATFNVDNTPPVIEISSPSETAASSGPVSYVVSYTDADSISLSAGDVTLNKTGTANGTVSVSGTGLTERTVTISNITGDGTIGISIAADTAADALGNSAPAAGPSETFEVDNDAPSLMIGSPSVNYTKAGPVTFEISYSDATSVTLSGADITLNKTGTATGTIGVSGAGLTTRTVTVSDISGDGTIGISIAAGTAADDLQNSAAAAGPSNTFVVDNTAPSSLTLSLDKDITNGPDIIATFDGSTDDNGVTYELKVNDKPYEAAASPRSVAVVKLDDGVHTIYVRAIDPAGNASPEASAQFTYDKTNPVVESVDHTPKLVSGGDLMDVVVAATDNFEVVSVIADGVYLTKRQDGYWAGKVSTAVGVGEHTVYVLAYDVAGNDGSYAWTYDTAPAVGLSIKAMSDSIILAAASKFVFTIWGRVTVMNDSDSFFVNDGSGTQMRVKWPNHGLTNGEYVSARGVVDLSSGPPVLQAYMVKRQY